MSRSNRTLNRRARRALLKGLAVATALVVGYTVHSCLDLSPNAEIGTAGTGSTDTAEVVSVYDGDTITVDTPSGRERVRLIGLDTPELSRNGTPSDCYADEARAELDALVYGKTVELHTDPSQDDRDRYGRLLRHVTINGTNAALSLIESGAAREYTYRTPYVGQAEHQAAERAAQAAGRGLWSACEQPKAEWSW